MIRWDSGYFVAGSKELILKGLARPTSSSGITSTWSRERPLTFQVGGPRVGAFGLRPRSGDSWAHLSLDVVLLPERRQESSLAIVGVLSSLLPGLRDLRNPLAAGYVWLVDLWLIFGGRIPSREEATGIVAKLYALDGVISQVGFVLALSFVAYLLGAISGSGSAILIKLLRRLPGSREVFNRYGESLDTEIARIFARYPGRRDIIPPPRPDVMEDLQAVRARLMAEQTTLYGEYDRLQSEAEFRVAILLPLTTLIAVVAFDVHPLWFLGLLAIGLLAYQAAVLQQQADLALVAAVSSGKIRSPLLEMIENELSAPPRREGNAT